MSPLFNFLAALMAPIFLCIASIATPVPTAAIHGVGDMSKRSATTCADPSLTRDIFQGFTAAHVCHLLNFREAFVSDTTRLSDGSSFYTLQGAVFKAWPTQQPFTVPLFRLSKPDASDFVFMVGADAQTPPIASGFQAGGIVAWVYNTAVCDSVPLMSATFATLSDHYYTTDAAEHAGLLANGWTDTGVVAFVLPL